MLFVVVFVYVQNYFQAITSGWLDVSCHQNWHYM